MRIQENYDIFANIYNIKPRIWQPRTKGVDQASTPWIYDSCFQPGVRVVMADKRQYSAFPEMLKLKTARLRLLV